MQLGDLLDDATMDVATASLEIANVELDSRQCVPGTLFLALPGHTTDGARFAAEARDRGAVAVLSDHDLDVGIPVVVVPSSQLRALASHASATIVDHPELELELVGVTGTNGKTTIVTVLEQLARQMGWNGASIGTLTSERTTPAAPELFRRLRELVDEFDPARRRLVALEVSSHALDQRRVDGLRFAASIFTNLGHDHLDYHHTLEEYFQAKARLFTPELSRLAVIWTDDAHGARLAESIAIGCIPVSREDASSVTLSMVGATFFWRGHLVRSPLVGAFNIDNALLALTTMASLGAAEDEVVDAFSRVRPVSGRFDVVHEGDFTVVVDFAHTPEGLARILSDVRELSPSGALTVVFGCGGDRDVLKRPEMGAVAGRLADRVVVTSDNPRSEDPESIIDAVVGGLDAGRDYHREADRREAIAWALKSAQPGDVVVIAGKGHETSQTLADRVIAFDDRTVVREILG